MRTIIEKCQPYNRTYPDLPPLLLILNTLENADKHRLLRVAFSAIVTGNIGFTGPAVEGGSTPVIWVNHGEIKDGAEIVTYTFDRPTPNMKFDRFEFYIGVSLWHGKRDPSGPDGSDRTDVASLLALLNKEVREVVDFVCRAATM